MSKKVIFINIDTDKDMDTVINVVPNADIFRYSQFSTEYGRMFT